LLIFGIATFQIPMLKAIGYFRLARDESDTLFRQYRALADGAKELRLHKRRREAFYSWLGVTTRTLQRHTTVGNAIATAAANWGEILFFIFIGFLLFVLPSIIRIDNATLTAYVLTILFMRTPLAQLLNDIPNLGSATVATEKIETLGLSLLAQPLEESSTGEATSIRPWKHLGLVGVTHTYRHDGEDKDFVLGPINLSLYPGELIFLIGGNGSGKTTLAKILTGLYVPESGEVRFNDESVTIESRDLYRQYFSAVFTDFYLFETLLGLEGPAIDLKAHEYLVKLQLNHKVKVEDGALSTVDLSQGQRKRLALLTAYLEDRPIFLFDEWAADQDPLFKEVFYYSLLPELKARGKTVIVISHDDRYYHVADRIIKLNYGQLEYDKYVAQPEGLFSEKAQTFS
jgi:putative pyoverdin transport system ATP-binding/permease protein